MKIKRQNKFYFWFAFKIFSNSFSRVLNEIFSAIILPTLSINIACGIPLTLYNFAISESQPLNH